MSTILQIVSIKFLNILFVVIYTRSKSLNELAQSYCVIHVTMSFTISFALPINSGVSGSHFPLDGFSSGGAQPVSYFWEVNSQFFLSGQSGVWIANATGHIPVYLFGFDGSGNYSQAPTQYITVTK